MQITTEKELGEALKRGEETIEIEGDLADKTFKIKATGKVAWAVAIGALAVAIVAVIAMLSTGGGSTPASVPVMAAMAPVAASILGPAVAGSAIMIAIAGGGVAILSKLRKYKIVSRTKGKLVLKR